MQCLGCLIGALLPFSSQWASLRGDTQHINRVKWSQSASQWTLTRFDCNQKAMWLSIDLTAGSQPNISCVLGCSLYFCQSKQIILEPSIYLTFSKEIHVLLWSFQHHNSISIGFCIASYIANQIKWQKNRSSNFTLKTTYLTLRSSGATWHVGRQGFSIAFCRPCPLQPRPMRYNSLIKVRLQVIQGRPC